MQKTCSVLILLAAIMIVNASEASTVQPADARIPVIAVISQPATTYNSKWPEATKNWSEVVGSYVDWVQQTGAEVALIPFDMPWDVMTQVLSQTQGMVLPGGAAELVDEHHKVTEYQGRISRILRWVQYQNNNGNFYPVWGTCLGMESLMIHFHGNDGRMLQEGFEDKSQYHKVDQKKAFWKSKFFGSLNVDKKDLEYVFGNDIPYYYHSEGVDVDQFKKTGVGKRVRLQGTSKNNEGREYVAILEAADFPIYFTQFHPEKHQFEKRSTYKPMDRSERTIKVMTSFIFKLVELARKRATTLDLIPQSVQAYFPEYASAIWSPVKSFERIYMFKNYFGLSDLPEKKAGRLRRLLGKFEQNDLQG